MIEIKSINVLNNVNNIDGYEVELPVDSYKRVASTYVDGYTTQTLDLLDVIADDTITDNIVF